MEFLFVRHGQTDYNKAGRYQGWADVPLNNTGREQAKKAHAILKPHTVNIAFVSTLGRAMETADIVLHDRQRVARTNTDALWERGFGALEGEDADIVRGHYWPGTVSFRRLQGVEGEHQPEAKGAFMHRIETVLSDVLECAEQEKAALIVAHGGVYACLHRLLGIHDIAYPENAGVYRFSLDQGKAWQCQQLS